MSSKPQNHTFVVDGFMPWSYCIFCGLISLRNPISQLAVSLGCDHAKHPKYIRAVEAEKRKAELRMQLK